VHEKLLLEYNTLGQLKPEQRAILFDSTFFDPALCEIERNLRRFIEEFTSLGY
jgi:hypothetical protein